MKMELDDQNFVQGMALWGKRNGADKDSKGQKRTLAEGYFLQQKDTAYDRKE